MVQTNMQKTLGLAVLLSITTSITAYIVQRNAHQQVPRCSYLDPVTIDVLAFLAGVFLIIEGFYRILEHKKEPLRNQLTRTLRIAFGCAIITLHIMQVLHK